MTWLIYESCHDKTCYFCICENQRSRTVTSTSVFFPCLNSRISLVSISEIPIVLLDSVDAMHAKACLCMNWSKTLDIEYQVDFPFQV